jgi:hypothetical protein
MARSIPFDTSIDTRTTQVPAGPKRSLLRRLLDAVIESQQRRAEREIARYLRGIKFTDDVEREIERRFLNRL